MMRTGDAPISGELMMVCAASFPAAEGMDSKAAW
jgi:hypothetical protein